MKNEIIEVFDAEAAGVLIEGLSAGQIKKLKEFYVNRTGDVDCERIEHFTKGL